MQNITVKLDNIFSSFADALVIPRSTTGTMTNGFRMGLEKLNIEVPQRLQYRALGSIDIDIAKDHRSSNNLKPERHVIYATSVDNDTSTYEAIEDIAKQIARFSTNNPTVRDIAMPLLGTGAGGLDHNKVFNILTDAFEKAHPNCHLYIYINEEAIYNNVVNKIENKIKFNNTELLLDEIWHHKSFFFVSIGNNSDSDYETIIDNGIWVSDIQSKTAKIVKSGDVLFLTISYLTDGGSNFISIYSVGSVKKNINNLGMLEVDWIKGNVEINIEGLANYSKEIRKAEKSEVKTLLAEFEKIGIDILNLNNNTVSKEDSTTISKRNNTSLPGILNDGISGEDYLEIRNDVLAFSRIIALKIFSPPLSIALFGKWGSGKSFFMEKMITQINALNGSSELYCKGVVQIRFNAWSYLDANLWASIVTKIFSELDRYIREEAPGTQFQEGIKIELLKKLEITKESAIELETEKIALDSKLEKLEKEKSDLEDKITKAREKIKASFYEDFLKKVDEQFNTRSEIFNAIKANASIEEAKEYIGNIIPKEYLDNPVKAYELANSRFLFFKEFFRKGRVLINVLCLAAIIAIVVTVPYLTNELSRYISAFSFTIPKIFINTIAASLPIWLRVRSIYNKIQPIVASLWQVKEDYEAKLQSAKIDYEQQKEEILSQININEERLSKIGEELTKVNVDSKIVNGKLNNSLSTEALYSFIATRSQSSEYHKHLGIVSSIRSDFETLSALFAGHQDESRRLGDNDDIKDLYKNHVNRIVLYIDDLDRCPEDRVIEVLEAVNLLMAFKLFVVVVGVDPRWVKNSLIKRYHLQFAGKFNGIEIEGIEKIDASNYLEKIFQIPFHLKEASDKTVKYMLQELTKPNLQKQVNADVESDDVIEDVRAVKEEMETVGEIREETRIMDKEETDDVRKIEPEMLKLTEKEVELMQSVSEIIGNNPRAIKRFVNTYQIARVHGDFKPDENNEERDYLLLMFLLALPIGPYKALYKHYVSFISDAQFITSSLSNFLNTDADTSENANISNLKKSLVRILENTLIYNTPVVGLKRYHLIVHRFIFDDGN